VGTGQALRRVAGPAAENYPDIEPSPPEIVLHLLVASLLEKQPFSMKSPFLATCAVRPKYVARRGPWCSAISAT
jgi:hypothetical protein